MFHHVLRFCSPIQMLCQGFSQQMLQLLTVSCASKQWTTFNTVGSCWFSVSENFNFSTISKETWKQKYWIPTIGFTVRNLSVSIWWLRAYISSAIAESECTEWAAGEWVGRVWGEGMGRAKEWEQSRECCVFMCVTRVWERDSTLRAGPWQERSKSRGKNKNRTVTQLKSSGKFSSMEICCCLTECPLN